MGAFIRRAACLLVCGALALGLSGCDRTRREPIDDVRDLEGRRVGVSLGESTDYRLTGREDMELLRYDSVEGMLLPLRQGQLDAVCLDYYSWRLAQALTAGLRTVEPPISEDGLVFFFSGKEEALCRQFNDFLAWFTHTPEYADLMARVLAFDGTDYQEVEVPATGTGRVLRVSADIDCYPSVHLDPATGAVKGFEIELLTRFANACDYQLDLAPSDYTDAELGLRYGRYDMMIGQISELYLDPAEAEMAGVYVSDSFMTLPLYLMEVDDPDQVQVLGSLGR